jgi:hypothetical protein
MINFKKGSKVKVLGRNATVNRKIKYGDIRTVTNTMSDSVQLDEIDDGWLEDTSVELAEDTSKPVTDGGNIYEIGKYYLFTDNGKKFTLAKLTHIGKGDHPFHTNEKDFFRYMYEVGTLENTGTITPAPIELIDGNAYMFDCVEDKNAIGIYDKSSGKFYYALEGYSVAKYCTNIRLMTVAESK